MREKLEAKNTFHYTICARGTLGTRKIDHFILLSAHHHLLWKHSNMPLSSQRQSHPRNTATSDIHLSKGHLNIVLPPHERVGVELRCVRIWMTLDESVNGYKVPSSQRSMLLFQMSSYAMLVLVFCTSHNTPADNNRPQPQPIFVRQRSITSLPSLCFPFSNFITPRFDIAFRVPQHLSNHQHHLSWNPHNASHSSQRQ